MNEKFKLIDVTKGLIDYITSLVANYPRVKYDLKSRILDTSHSILKGIYKANIRDDRLEIQKDILVDISMLDYYLDYSYKNKLITYKQLSKAAGILTTVRKMMSGWIKSES